MKRFYFSSNGEIRVHARLCGAYHQTDGSLVPPQFSLLGVECGDSEGKYAFPAYWWNEAKSCGGYFHLTRVEELFEPPASWAQPHDQDATEDFFTEMELGGKHFPVFPIRLPSFGQSAKDVLWSLESIRRYEYRTGQETVWADGNTTSQRLTEL
jgi:hypothetical protein